MQNPERVVLRMKSIASHIEPSVIAQALDQSINAVLLTDANSGKDGHRIVYTNVAFLRMTGYSEDEILGQNPRILQGPVKSSLPAGRSCSTAFQFLRIIAEREGRPGARTNTKVSSLR